MKFSHIPPAAIFLWFGIAALAGQDSVPSPDLLSARETAAWRLIATLQSPFCPGLTLESCPSWYADSLRTVIRQRMAAGESPDVIRRELARDFGQPVLGEPTWQGFDLLGWIGPGLLLLVAGTVLVAALRRRGRPAPGPAVVTDPGEPFGLNYIPAAERERLTRRLAAELRGEGDG